jgi:hypothetical protein
VRRGAQDGRFARKFNQCTTFGAVLDMVTDRCARAVRSEARTPQRAFAPGAPQRPAPS